MNLGATGKFPRGKVHESDEGELRMAIFTKDDCVIVEFGKPTAWLGLPRDVAIEFADKVRERALSLPHSA